MPRRATIPRPDRRRLKRSRVLLEPENMTSQTATVINENASTPSALDKLHETIDACRECEANIPNLCKPVRMLRGEPGSVMIVGQGPGKKERAVGLAFAGPSGKRLDEWLRQCRKRGA